MSELIIGGNTSGIKSNTFDVKTKYPDNNEYKNKSVMEYQGMRADDSFFELHNQLQKLDFMC